MILSLLPRITVDAFNTIYKKEESRTTLKDNKYYRYHNNDMPGAWTGKELDDDEVVHPDGICSSTVMTSMKPILAENAMKKFAFPHLNARMWPDVYEDEEGYLRYIDIQKVIQVQETYQQRILPCAD